MARRLLLLAPLAVAACGRAGPGATLSPRKDPDIEAREDRDEECTKLVAHGDGVRNRRVRMGGFHCEEWKTNSVTQVDAVRPDEVPAHQGPAPRFGIVPTVALGRSVATSGADPSAASYWLDVGVQLQVVPRADRFAGYLAASYVAIGGQSDLSAVSFTAGPMLALSAGWVIEGHGGVVMTSEPGWRAGFSVRWRPQHRTTLDWTVNLGVEHIRGDDVLRTEAPFVMEPNHSTGLLLGVSGGLLP